MKGIHTSGVPGVVGSRKVILDSIALFLDTYL
jgi:hypothetical protein